MSRYSNDPAEYPWPAEYVPQQSAPSGDAPSESRATEARCAVSTGSSLKAAISQVLQAALDGSDETLRHEKRFIRWGLVEQRIHALIDAAPGPSNT